MVKAIEKSWALILGGSSGLGLASAKKLARYGFNICIVHRSPRSMMPIIDQEFSAIQKEGVSFLSFNVDATNALKRGEVIELINTELRNKKGIIKVLLHSISKGNLKPMVGAQTTLQNDDFSLTINAMAISLYDWTKCLFTQNLFAEDTRIISFTSEGNSRAMKNYAAVSAAKVALEAITRNIAVEFARYGIRANCIQAGVTDTASFRLIPESDQIADFSIKRNPFKRLTKPEDVADVVYLLCKKEASWINGAIIPVDGGEHLI